MNRRSALAATAGLVGCAGARPRVEPVQTEAGGRMERLYAWASRAPSRHNEQPWRVVAPSLEATTFLLEVDPSRRLPAVDPAGASAELALGGFFEAMRLVAPGEGLEASSTRIEGGFRVELRAAPKREVTPAVLLGRTTHREPFEAPGQATFRALAAAEPSVELHVDGSARHRALAELSVEAGDRQADREDAARELGRFIHKHPEDAERAADGYTLESLGVRGWSAWAIRRLVDGDLTAEPRFRDETRKRVRELVAATPAWLVVPGPPFEAGRTFLRLSLLAANLGLALHPMHQALEDAAPSELASAAGREGVAMLVRVGSDRGLAREPSRRRARAAFVTLRGSG